MTIFDFSAVKPRIWAKKCWISPNKKRHDGHSFRFGRDLQRMEDTPEGGFGRYRGSGQRGEAGLRFRTGCLEGTLGLTLLAPMLASRRYKPLCTFAAVDRLRRQRRIASLQLPRNDSTGNVGGFQAGKRNSRASAPFRFQTFRPPVSPTGRGGLQSQTCQGERVRETRIVERHSLRFPALRLPSSRTAGGRLRLPEPRKGR